MRVVADSSPLLYLVLIEQADLLPALFGEIVIPEEVARELARNSVRTCCSSTTWMAVALRNGGGSQ